MKTFNQVFSFLLQNSCYTDCTFFAVKMEEHFVILVFREIIHLCLDQKTPANSNHCFPEQRPRNEFISKSVSSKKVCFYWTITFIVLVGGKLSHLKSKKFEIIMVKGWLWSARPPSSITRPSFLCNNFTLRCTVIFGNYRLLEFLT